MDGLDGIDMHGSFDDIIKNNDIMLKLEPKYKPPIILRPPAPAPGIQPDYEKISVALTANLLRVYLEMHQKSFVISPYTTQTTMGMCFMGSDCLTKKELSEKIFANDSHVGTYLSRLVKSASEIDSLRTVTRLLSTDRAEFYPGYRKKVRAILDKDNTCTWAVAGADFESGDHGRIAEALDGIIEKKLGGLEMANGTLTKEFLDTSMRLLVLQAFSYTTKWHSPFEPGSTPLIIDNLFFRSADDGGVPVEYMQQEGTFRYFEDARWKVLRKAVTTEGNAVYFMLPTDRRQITPSDFLYPEYAELIKRFRMCSLRNVKVVLPKFRLDSPWHSVADEMKRLGLVDTFRHMRANFCHMVRVYDLENGFGISKMIEKSSFQLDEGIDESVIKSESISSIASNVSVSQDSEGENTVVFRADSPFLFFLVHEDPSFMMVLLAGRYAGP